MNIKDAMKPAGHDLLVPSEVPPGRRDQWCALAKKLGVQPGQEEQFRVLVNQALCAAIHDDSAFSPPPPRGPVKNRPRGLQPSAFNESELLPFQERSCKA